MKLTKKQSQDGGFLPLLLGALDSIAPTVLGSLFGKGLQIGVPRPRKRGRGLQIDSEQRAYRRVPIVKTKNKIQK